MERGSRKRSSSAGSEKWRELVADRKKWKDIVRTGQSPQWAVVPMEEDEGAFKPNVFLKDNNNFNVFLLEYIGCWLQK